MKKTKILVVNGFSSGNQLIQSAKERGYECYHMITNLEKAVPESYIKHNMVGGYDGYMRQQDTFEATLELVKSYDFDAIIPGTESGVILAEQLADALKLPCNDMKMALARRDKYYMQKALEDAGIRGIRSILTKSSSEACDWFEKNGNKKVVLKPRMDAGGIGFYKCSNTDEIKEAFNNLYGQKSIFGEDVSSPDVLMQEYVEGPEIVVNHVSSGGKHRLVEIYLYEKEGAVYKTASLIKELTPEYNEAVEYTEKILDALGISYGSSHTEIMMTVDGPRLIETGARIMGEYASREVCKEAMGYSVVDLTLESYLNEEVVSKKYEYHPKNNYTWVFLRSFQNAKLKSIPLLNIVKSSNLIKFSELDGLIDSMEIVKTTDLVTNPGVLYLIDDKDKIDCWIKLLQYIEENYPEVLYEKVGDRPLTDKEKELKNRLISMGS